MTNYQIHKRINDSLRHNLTRALAGRHCWEPRITRFLIEQTSERTWWLTLAPPGCWENRHVLL